jgi:hypothetical protein
MNTKLIDDAFGLFIETMPLETLDINADSHRWHDLYAKECKLFDLMRQMNSEELEEYQHKVWMVERDIEEKSIEEWEYRYDEE